MEKPLKWIYGLTEEEQRNYPLSRIIVGFDRVEGKYITADEIWVIRTPDLNQQRNRRI